MKFNLCKLIKYSILRMLFHTLVIIHTLGLKLLATTTTTRVKTMNKYFKTTLNMHNTKNIVEAIAVSNIIRKVSGIAVYDIKITPDNRIIRKYSILGCLCFLLWYSLYFYCTYKAHDEDQTILRNIYSTKVQRYGDDYERISSTLFVIFALWKIPRCWNTYNHFIEIVVKVDKAFEDLGDSVDYSRDARLALSMSIFQVVIYLVRFVSTWITLSKLDMPIPLERMYQVIFSDVLALIITAYFCFNLKVLRGRYEHINKVLEEIKNHKSWEYKLFVRGGMVANVQKAVGLQDKYICEKIQTCAKIYGMLYKVTDATNEMFGALVMVNMFVCLTYIILYMFYFMEATAAGLFHDVERYIVFIIYIAWQIVYAIVVIFLTVCVSERTVYEAQNTSFIIHEIINSDFSQSVTAEAMQLSIQCLHQKPIFTANGLYELNYALLHQFSRSVSTYLIILLQFVTDAK